MFGIKSSAHIACLYDLIGIYKTLMIASAKGDAYTFC